MKILIDIKSRLSQRTARSRRQIHPQKLLMGLLFFALVGTGLGISKQGLAQDSLKQNGVSVHWVLGREYYIGALYLPTLSSDPDEILSMAGNKRMELKVTSDKWSPRRFSQLWNQAILINNSQEDLVELSKAILAYTNISKDGLVYGDHLVIRYSPANGTQVHINGEKVFTTGREKFFNVLLNTWIGARPPSSEFKRDILTMPTNEDGVELLGRFNVIQPDPSRVAVDLEAEKAKIKAEEEKLAARKAAEKKATEKRATDKRKREQLAKQKRETERLAAEKREKARLEAERLEQKRLAAEKDEAERLAAEKVAAEQRAGRKREQDRLAAAKREQERLKAERMEQERIAAEREAAEKQAQEMRLAEERAAEAEEAQRLAEQRKAAEKLLAEKREAERKAGEKRERDRLAAQKLEQERLKAERQEQERLAADKRAAEKIAAQKREAQRLAAKKREADLLAAKKREAERLAAEAKVLAAEKKAEELAELEEKKAQKLAKLEEKRVKAKPAVDPSKVAGLYSLYRANMLRSTYRHVTYPARSRNLKQEGTVVLKVTVNRKGKVLDVEQDKSSKYVALNKAAEKAVKKAQPYNEVPEQMAGDKFEFKIPIKFRIPG